MVLHHEHRLSLYEGLTRLAPKDAVDEVLSHFPTRKTDEPVTRDYLDRRLAERSSELRVEMERAMHRQTLWTVATIMGVGSVGFAFLSITT